MMPSVEIPPDHGLGVSRKSRRTRAFRDELFKKQDGKCYWCGLPMELNHFKKSAMVGRTKVNPAFATFEHLWPKSNGGLRTPDNMVLAHGACNHNRHKRKFPNDPVYGNGGSLPTPINYPRQKQQKKRSEAAPSDWSEGPVK